MRQAVKPPGLVLDTCVLISALLAPEPQRSAACALIDACLCGRLRIFHHPKILNEYREVLTRPEHQPWNRDAQAVLRAIEGHGISLGHCSLIQGEPLRDSEDQIFFNLLLTLRAWGERVYLATFNLRDFPAHEHILAPAALLARLRQDAAAL